MKPQVITAIPVPFTNEGEIDWPAYSRAVEFIDPHVDAMLVAGTTGEFPALEDDERLELFRVTRDILGPERTIAHIGHGSLRQVTSLAKKTKDLGISRMAALSPYYFPTDDEGIVDFYQGIVDAVPGVELYAYLFPERTGMDVSAEAMGEVFQIPEIVGVKLSGASNDLRSQYAARMRPGQEIYSGSDNILPQMMEEGGTGVVSGVSSVFPELFSTLVEALQSGQDHADAQAQVEAAVNLVGPSIKYLKAGLAERVGGDWASRMSMPKVSSDQAEKISEATRV